MQRKAVVCIHEKTATKTVGKMVGESQWRLLGNRDSTRLDRRTSKKKGSQAGGGGS